VEELLAAEPGNAEYLDVKESLAEVIALTADLLASTAAAGGAGDAGDGGAAAGVSGAACQALYDG
jgi:survival-of-motor-neuron-related-splicing factor 30